MGARPGDPDDRPDHARGKGHARARSGHCAPRRSTRSPATRRSRTSPRSASTRRWSPRRARRSARPGVHVASVATGFPSGQTFLDLKLAETRQAIDAGADEIDMVIDAVRVPRRRLPDRVRGDRRGQGCLRRHPSQGHPRDRRARDLRQRPARVDPGDGRRRRLHQDLDRQGHAGGDAPGHAGHARGESATSSAGPAGRSG